MTSTHDSVLFFYMFLLICCYPSAVAFSQIGFQQDASGWTRGRCRQPISSTVTSGLQPSTLPVGCLLSNLNGGGSPSSPSSNFGDYKNDNNHLKTPKILNWDLPTLLSQDSSTEAKLIALMDVYNDAVSAGKRAGSEEQEESYPQKRTLESLDYSGYLSPHVAPFRRFVRKYNYDIGHDGRFTVFDSGSDDENTDSKSEGASLQADVVFSMDNPLAYIRDVLSYRGDDGSTRCTSSSNGDGSKDEAVVFVPGLHTFHETRDQKTKQRTSTERVKYCSQVLEGMPIAQIHAGTYLDQGDLDIEVTPDTLKALKSFGLLMSNDNDQSYENEDSNDHGRILCRLRAKDLDIVRTSLCRASSAPFSIPKQSCENGDLDRLKRTMMKLIDIAVESVLTKEESPPTPHLVLMSYSATCNVLAAALSEWKHQATTATATTDHSTSDVYSEQEAESLLRKSVTVVTFGALCEHFVDGPAYIHVSMHDDRLASLLGVSKQRHKGGGKDALYFQGISPYAPSFHEGDLSNDDGIYANDAHSMDACAIQYLSLIRRINGVTSFRDLYDLGKDDNKVLDIKSSLFALNYKFIGQLEMPSDLDEELLPSMIRATGGERWLWNPGYQLGDEGVDGFDSPLPDLNDAEGSITNQFGYNVYDEIVEMCWKH